MELKDKLYHVKNQLVVLSSFLASLKRVANDLELIGRPVDDEDVDLVLRALDGVEELFNELVEFEGSMERIACQYCDEQGHSAKTCHRIVINQPHDHHQLMTTNGSSSSSSSSSSWLLDSATTQHITNALRNLSFPQFHDGSEMEGSLCGTTGSTKLILAPIVIPYKLCCGSQSSSNNNCPSPPPQPPNAPPPPKQLDAPSIDPQQQPPPPPPPPPSPSEVLRLPSADYEVFLSFRGPDTRQQFTNYLFLLLKNHGVRTFMDDNDLYQGDDIGPSLTKAIEQSKIYIPIFSENYAESKWCLIELAKMVECQERDKRHVIAPIFYLVDPTDVKKQTGSYEKAFQQHEKKFSPEMVRKWKHALEVVGHKAGWTIKSKDDKHANTIDNVTSFVLSNIHGNESSLYADQLVGIDGHVNAVTEKLSLDSGGVIMVGLHGFGGIGKTTIASAVYHKLAAQFDRRCFLENIREAQKRDKEGTINLQKKILASVMTRKDSGRSINTIGDGVNRIRDRLSQFKLLIVLDDVDDRFKFEEVLGDPKNFLSGSRFIITTRDTKVLGDLDQYCKLYEVRPMNQRLSFRLFCKYAFQMSSPKTGYETLSTKFVKKMEGVPLVLKVVGSSLFRQNISFWEGMLEKLEEIPDKEVIERLKISYEPLDDQTKQIFLDIACFYIGKSKLERPYLMWSDLHFYPDVSITILIQRSLIKIEDGGSTCQMHDQLRDMGRAIVREENIEQPWMRSRVWDKKDARELLEDMKGSNKVKALSVGDAYTTGKLTREHFLNLSELRYFEAKGVKFDGDFSNILSNLRWLCLHSFSNEGHHGTSFHMRNLVILDLSGSEYLKDDWGGWTQIKMANKLKILELSGCRSLAKLPDFPQSGSLEVLNLSGVCGLDSGVELDIKNLQNVKELLLRDGKLERISGGTIGRRMKRLQLLDLTGLQCHNLNEVLVDIEKLRSLVGLLTIKTILDDIQVPRARPMEDMLKDHMAAKKTMVKGHNYRLRLGKLPPSLKVLHTSSQVVNLSELLELESLGIEDCDSVLQIPSTEDSSWWKLSKLRSMMLVNTNIAMAAETSTTNSSSSSHRLPSSLDLLFIWDCLESERLPTLENLENLTTLSIAWCGNLREIQGLERLLQFDKLEILDIACCPLLTSTLSGAGCGRIIMSSLKVLCISNCGNDIPHLSNFPRLAELEIGRITDDEAPPEQIQEMESRLEGIAGLEELEELRLYELKFVERLPSLSKLRKLTNLSIRDLPRLREIQGLTGLTTLEMVVLAGCTALKRIVFPADTKQMKELDIRGCRSLIPPHELPTIKAKYLAQKNNYVPIRWPDEPYEAGLN